MSKIIPSLSTFEWMLAKGNPITEHLLRNEIGFGAHDSPSDATVDLGSYGLLEQLVTDVTTWPWYPLKRHNDANHPQAKLVFLADTGIGKAFPSIQGTIERVEEHISDEGHFQTLMEIGKSYAKNLDLAEPTWIWMACDAPALLYSVAGLKPGSTKINAAAGAIADLFEDVGVRCKAWNPKWRGPGRKADPCPYATLISIKALASVDAKKFNSQISTGIETLLDLWDKRKERKPFLFAMGRRFKQLKFPNIYYNIVFVLSVLVPLLRDSDDARYQEMLQVLLSKRDEHGLFTPESQWRAWKEWDFARKKSPSPTLTAYIYSFLNKGGLLELPDLD